MGGKARSPNILFVFADQMRGVDMGCAGNSQIVTPVMDRLAEEGVMCSRHYATCPLCSPNRATMLTGTYPTTHRLIFNDYPMRTDLASLGTLAKANGCRAGYVGKWHIDGGPRDRFIPPGPRRLVFDDFWATLNCGHDYFEFIYYRDDSPTPVRARGYEPETQTELAIDFLKQCGRQRPFCLVVSWGPPHNPYEQVPDKYRRMYDETAIAFRPNCREIPRAVLDPAWSHRPTTRDYYAQITSLDEMLGRLLAALDEIGAAQDTIVVFTSDHGDMMWSQGLLYKCVPFEESIGVPLLLRYPRGLPRGRVCGAPIGSVDLLPTLAGLAGWTCPGSVEGADFAPVLRGRRPEADEPAFIAQYSPYLFRQDFPVPEWRGLRTKRYTFTVTPDRRPWLFFDNDADPYQMRNLAADPAHQSLAAELTGKLDRKLREIRDPFLPYQEMADRFNLPQYP